MNTINLQYVSKPLPVFTIILENKVEFNKYLKEVILEHRQKFPETTKSNVKAWHSSWVTHKENPKFQPLADITLDACKFISAGDPAPSRNIISWDSESLLNEFMDSLRPCFKTKFS